MSLPDSAEYWQDVKASRPYRGYVPIYHIPGLNCGHSHRHNAILLGDVTCRSCLKKIAEGYQHGLSDGKTDFRSKGEKKRERKRELAKIEHEKYGKCGHCNGFLKLRLNSIKKTFFLGCENFPKCKYTRTQ